MGDLTSASYVNRNPRLTTITSSATPTLNTDTSDALVITALAVDITSMTTNLTGTPTNLARLVMRFLDTGSARAITWGAKFAPGTVPLPPNTIAGKRLFVAFFYNTTTAQWQSVASGSEP